MKYRFFHVPALDSAAETEVLNRFLAERRIVAVDRQFVADGGNSFWAFSVAYRDGASASDPMGAAGRAEKTKIDYREVFDERDFATLRTLRKELAEAEGVPAYALFTNEQLAAMVRGKARTVTDLAAIEGVGKSRVEKYAAAFLKVLADSPQTAATKENDRAPRAD
ncbi:MAG TPA: HRDC domain-containing protein [Candidatus Competibacter phosphatis]|nr:HRDC domain-containing protein [Candidatus Competibacter phosphatis]HMR01823.1 HRDC domain-containing protein [Candidatus Competibacter phosphatis]